MEDETVVLIDDCGKESEYIFLDLIQYRDEEYVALLPAEEGEGDNELMILKVEDCSEDSETYISVEDEETLDSVFEIFKMKMDGILTFEE